MKNMFNFATILAGGRGQRLERKTRFSSKSLLDVNGHKLIDYSLSQLKSIKYKTVTVGPFKDSVINHCFTQHGINSFIVTEDKGNCWWVFNSFFKEIDSPILVLPCDLIAKIDLEFIQKEYNRLKSPMLMLVPIRSPALHNGDFLETCNSRIVSIGREKMTKLFASGIQVLNPKLISDLVKADGVIPEDFADLWNSLITKKVAFHSSVYPHEWYSINSQHELDYYKENVHQFYEL